jgi:hypothetical protein
MLLLSATGSQNFYRFTGKRKESSSIDVEPNAHAAVPLYSPTIRKPLDDWQPPSPAQVVPWARDRRDLEAGARITHLASRRLF